ncbi:acyltransferase [Flavobacterium sp. W21_SRS_FM6]|uniref:acyltransferase n=1 Tax=Flavobacterium sp. W21_SRS_FM6 TaxID=3240268 RepID=UPI003F923174
MNIKGRYSFVKYGKNVHIQWNVEIFSPNKNVVIGNNVGINSGTVIISDLVVGNDVLIAPKCGFINRGEHTYDVCGQTIFCGPRARSEVIIIKDDVWIGYGSTILGGITIGEGSIVAAGSTVINDVPEYSIVAGNPAKLIKMRFNKEEIIAHKDMLRKRNEKK